MRKVQPVSQGKTVIECDGDAFLIMHPDGTVVGASSRRNAEQKAKKWYQSDLGDGEKIGIGEIEWR